MQLVFRETVLSPLLVGFLRVAIASPCLWLAARLLEGPFPRIGTGDAWRLGLAGVATSVYQVCYFHGVDHVGVAIGSLVAIGSAPLFMLGLGALWLGEPVTRTTAIALGLGATGGVLLTLGPHGVAAMPPRFASGVALALVAGFCYAAYAVLAKSAVARIPPLPLAAVAFTVSAVVLLPVLAWVPLGGPGPRAWALLVYLGVVPTALAYVVYGMGLRTTPVSASGVLTLIEPLTATLLGVAFFGDRLGTVGAVGAALLLAAIAILATAPRAAPVSGAGDRRPARRAR
jgi:DME family drug/metabolite transporter